MSRKVIRKGNLVYRERKNGATGTEMQPVLLRCPVCGYEFKHGLNRATHIGNHTPEEFGL